VRLHEKGGKRHDMPCHHNLDAWLQDYLEGCGLSGDRRGALFRTIARGTGRLSDRAMQQADAYAMIRRRATAAGIETLIGNHSFRARWRKRRPWPTMPPPAPPSSMTSGRMT
jgi:site-specific recombinase XerC